MGLLFVCFVEDFTSFPVVATILSKYLMYKFIFLPFPGCALKVDGPFQ